MNKKLKAAVIGTSIMGMRHVSAVLAHKDAELAAICDIDPTTLNMAGDEFSVPVEKRFTNWRDLLGIEGLNVVLLVTPDQLHQEMSEAFLEKGIHVMCEKPLALTHEGLCGIVRAANKSSAKFMVGQVSRFTDAFIKAKEIVDAGIIGELYYAESEYAHDYAKMLPAWRMDPDRHGVVGGGCHAVDLLRWIVGDPIEVFAYGSHKLLPQVSYDDATIAVMKFPNNAIGKVFVSTGCKRPYTMRTLFYGTKGTIICDNTSDTMQLYTLGEDGIDVNPNPEIISVTVDNHNTVREFEIFADHILNDTPVEMDARLGAKTIAVCLAIVESANTGKPVAPNYEFSKR